MIVDEVGTKADYPHTKNSRDGLVDLEDLSKPKQICKKVDVKIKKMTQGDLMTYTQAKEKEGSDTTSSSEEGSNKSMSSDDEEYDLVDLEDLSKPKQICKKVDVKIKKITQGDLKTYTQAKEKEGRSKENVSISPIGDKEREKE